jgi:hypothetical protein
MMEVFSDKIVCRRSPLLFAVPDVMALAFPSTERVGERQVPDGECHVTVLSVPAARLTMIEPGFSLSRLESAPRWPAKFQTQGRVRNSLQRPRRDIDLTGAPGSSA